MDAKHREAMGDAIWLYLYIHSRVRFSGEQAGVTPEDAPYRHTDAHEALGLSLRAVKYEYERLEDAGYIHTERHVNHGLIVSITKYEAVGARAKSKRRVQSTASGETEPSAIDGTAECNPLHSRVQSSVIPSATDCTPIYKDARDKRTNDSNETNGGDARARSPLQLVVDAYFDGMGRDPTKVGREYARHTPAGSELAESGQTPQDVRNCTRWLASDPWRRSKGKMPSLADVAAALPGWIEDRRPGKYAPPQDRPARGVSAALNVLGRDPRSALRALTGGGGDNEQRPALPAVRRALGSA